MREAEHARMLFEVAMHHVRALRGMNDSTIFADDIFGFQAQQAVEKMLKCLLSHGGKTYARTHDLELLIQQLTETDTVPECFHAMVDMNDFAVQFRYEFFADDPLDRTAVLASVEACLCHVQTVLAGGAA